MEPDFSCRPGKKKWLYMGLTFAFVSLTWVFFRADDIKDAGYVLAHLFDGITNPIAYLAEGRRQFQMAGMVQSSGMKTLLTSCLCILVLLIHDYLDQTMSVWKRLGRLKKPLRYALYFLLLFVILYSRQLGEYEFVYFQF